MPTPSQTASTLLLGTGVGCFLIVGFGFVQDRIAIDGLSTGLLFPLLGLLFIVLSRLVGSGSNMFPSEDDDMLVQRVQSDLQVMRKEESVGSAWAELEAAVLESELSEE